MRVKRLKDAEKYWEEAKGKDETAKFFTYGINKDTTKVDYLKERERVQAHAIDRKSTRLNSSHTVISYAVFCLKKKKKKNKKKHTIKNKINNNIKIHIKERRNK